MTSQWAPWRSKSPVYRHIDYFNRLLRCTSKKISQLCVTCLCEGNPIVTGGFHSQSASNAENASICRRHHYLIVWRMRLLLISDTKYAVNRWHSAHLQTLVNLFMEFVQCWTKYPYTYNYNHLHQPFLKCDQFDIWLWEFNVKSWPYSRKVSPVQVMTRAIFHAKFDGNPPSLSGVNAWTMLCGRQRRGKRSENTKSAWAPSQYKDRLIYVWWFPC